MPQPPVTPIGVDLQHGLSVHQALAGNGHGNSGVPIAFALKEFRKAVTETAHASKDIPARFSIRNKDPFWAPPPVGWGRTSGGD
jgi:hypothetical protein